MADAKQDSTVVLDFDALVRVKRTVKIFGVHYEMLSPEVYGIEQQGVLLKTRKSIQEYQANPKPANIQAYQKSQDELIFMIVPGLKDNPVYEEIPYQFKEAIIETFFGLLNDLKYLPVAPEETDQESEPSR
jgi:hypothetical protein